MATKKKRRKENQKGSLLNVLIFLMVLAIIGFAWLFLRQVVDVTEHDTDLTDRPVPMIARDLQELNQLIESEAEITLSGDLRDLFPGEFKVLMQQQDINGNGMHDVILTEDLNLDDEAMEELLGFGFDLAVSRLEVLGKQADGMIISLLSVDPQSMKDQHGESLIDQIPAPNGYALKMTSFSDAPYSSSVILFELAILDENHKIISDALTLYWHPTQKVYRATNAFGEPGTF
ncbi:MAG: hypothetical protein LAT67_13470 [Balneolales bacterium]|nr:hypothetical protein [Balneolales bacterium]